MQPAQEARSELCSFPARCSCRLSPPKCVARGGDGFLPATLDDVQRFNVVDAFECPRQRCTATMSPPFARDQEANE